ncbi:hypothetical protein [Microbacterium testaceum]|uniref:hypothetical protein n=1 Tax=Microbacterium testaceum TaxID=2033 RepID=UPI0015E18B69|nr:hypothetical protein [Microbacterium testaceum]
MELTRELRHRPRLDNGVYDIGVGAIFDSLEFFFDLPLHFLYRLRLRRTLRGQHRLADRLAIRYGPGFKDVS